MTIPFGLLFLVLWAGCPLSGFIYASHRKRKGDKDSLGLNFLQGAIMFVMVIALFAAIYFISELTAIEP